jgi:putative ABC transport system permease protein
VANLQLARGTARAREMAVRLSIGAGRRRLLRQLLTESVLLSFAGGVLGVLLAFAATRSVVSLMPEFYVPNESRVTINVPVLLFSLGVSLLTGIVFGLVPALQASKTDATDALKTGRGAGPGVSGNRIRSVLVIAEIALSVVLLVSAGLTIRTFVALQSVDVGIHAERVLLVGVPLNPTKYTTLEQRNSFAQALLDRVSMLPGVEAATWGHPFGAPQSSFTISGQNRDDTKRLGVTLAGADHLRTFGITLRAGRMFDASEVRRGDRVAVINEAALKLWPAAQNPIGSTVRLGILEQPPSRMLLNAHVPPEVTVIGVIANTKNGGLREEPQPVIVMPYTIAAPPQRVLAVRTTGDPNLLLKPARAQVRAMDPEQPLGRPITLSEILGQEVIQPRFTMAVFSVFAALGLALAAAGIYSVLSFHVARRTHELGIRMALGAPRRHVLALVLGMGGRLGVLGLAIGAAASLAATRLLRSQLFGVQSADPISYAAIVIVLGVAVFVACYLPARRAAGVDPMSAVRQD